MPSLANHQSNSFAKVLAIGDSKARKTSSLISLVQVGYKLRILDMDNLLDVLKGLILEKCPELIDNVEFRTLRDKRKATQAGSLVDGTPKALVEALKMLDRWKYKDESGEIDYGIPSTWGPDCILVVDSLSRLCDSAWDWADPMTPVGKTGEKDARATYGIAQDVIEQVVATLTGPGFATNVIVIAHVMYMEQPDGTMKGFPQGLGQKLSPKIPQYFPSVILYTKENAKPVIKTTSTPLIDLANPKPFSMGKSYSTDEGLAKIFEVLRGPLKAETPKVASIRR